MNGRHLANTVAQHCFLTTISWWSCIPPGASDQISSVLLQVFQESLLHINYTPSSQFLYPWPSLSPWSLLLPPSSSPAPLTVLFRPVVWAVLGTQSHLSSTCPSSWPKSSQRLHRLSKSYSMNPCQINLFSLSPFADHNYWSYLQFIKVLAIKESSNRVGGLVLSRQLKILMMSEEKEHLRWQWSNLW